MHKVNPVSRPLGQPISAETIRGGGNGDAVQDLETVIRWSCCRKVVGCGDETCGGMSYAG